MARTGHTYLRNGALEPGQEAPKFTDAAAQDLNASTSCGHGHFPYLIDCDNAGLSDRLKTFLRNRLGEASCECLLALYFSDCGKQIGESFLQFGERSHLLFEPLLLIDHGLALQARSLVIAHNHPAGVPLPSLSDLLSTRELAILAWSRGLVLAEHLIVGGRHIFSMRRSRMES